MRAAPILILSSLLAVAMTPAVTSEDGEETCRLVRGADTVTDATDDVEVCREEVWFHQADTKVANLAGQGHDRLPSWDTNRPETSVAGGAGAGYLGSSLYQASGTNDPTYHPTFEGTFTGPIDTLLVDLYLFPPNRMVEDAAGENAIIRVNADLTIDGKLVASHGELHVPLEDGGSAVKRIRFAWEDLYKQFESQGIDADAENEVRLQIVGTGIGTDAAIWVFDTSEVPSGMIFNATQTDLDGVAAS